jgi:Flp pilus assembly pilin Flp
MVATLLRNFWRQEDGQDLSEYALLMVFIAIACLALLGSGRPAVNSIWLASNNQLVQANGQAAGN